MNIRWTHRSNPIYRRAAALAALILLQLFLMAAVAEIASTPEPVDYEVWNNEHPDYADQIYIGLYWPNSPEDQRYEDLYQIRQTLRNSGYYQDAEPNYANSMLDQTDMKAIQDFWHLQTGGNYPTGLGLTYGAKDLILTPPEPTAAPHEYRDIAWGQTSDDLEPMLEQLYHLGYIKEFSHDFYDDEVRDAVRAFTENNGLGGYYENDTEDNISPITADLQRRIIETDIKNLNAMPEVKPDEIPYFLRTVEIAGLQIPMLVLWGVGLVVLVAGILVVIYLFMPSDKSADKTPKGRVHFTIEYQGKTQVIDAEITKTLKIGRGIGNFPLNLEDTKISRKHCELYYLNQSLMLRDYSSNGTMVNGKSVHNAECLLSSGDVILIGEHTITVKF